MSFGEGQRRGGEADAYDESDKRSDDPPTGTVPIVQALNRERIDDPQIDETDDRQRC
jgi:hypothetical protein